MTTAAVGDCTLHCLVGIQAGSVEEGNDGLPAQLGVLRVVGHLVLLVLLLRPVGHLQEAHQGEQVGEGELQRVRACQM